MAKRGVAGQQRPVRVFRTILALLLLICGLASLLAGIRAPAFSQDASPEYPWTGKAADGAVITQEELARLLAPYKPGLANNGKEEQKPNQKGTGLAGAALRGVNLRGVSLLRINLSGADLREGDLSGTYLFDAQLAGANLKNANLRDAILYRPDLRGADLTGANLEQAGLNLADLGKARLSGANLHKAYLRADLTAASLKGANLTEANLRRAILKEADLAGADLSEGNLRNAVLAKADLRGANLSGANLSEADLGEADLSGANLKGADLASANLSNASLRRANLRDARLNGVNFLGADLKGAVFEPHPGFLPSVHNLALANGLADLRYVTYPQSLVRLRQAFKEAGYRRQEREISCSLRRSETARDWGRRGLAGVKAALNYLFLDLTCAYGLAPWRPLALWGLGVLVFMPFYCLALLSPGPDAGIWRVWPPDRTPREEGRGEPEKLTTMPPAPLPAAGVWARAWWQIRRVLRIPAIGLYFSLVAALSLSWRGPAAGALVSRLQKRDYILKPGGWVRTVAGLQSLASAFLLAVWAVLYLAGLIMEN